MQREARTAAADQPVVRRLGLDALLAEADLARVGDYRVLFESRVHALRHDPLQGQFECRAASRFIDLGGFAEAVIRGRCDRGERYYGSECARFARREFQRASNRRHQASPRGRMLHARRQREYRARQRKLHAPRAP